jgi:hypothetical protein
MEVSGRWTRTTLLLAVLGSLMLPLAACQGEGAARPGDLTRVLPAQRGSSALVGIVAQRRGDLHDALVWVSEGPRRLAVTDARDGSLRVDILGPQKPGENDLDLLVPDAGGQSAQLLDLGFKAPDAGHQGYWMDDVRYVYNGTKETDDEDLEANVNRVISIVEKVYLKAWNRPMSYTLKIQRSPS